MKEISLWFEHTEIYNLRNSVDIDEEDAYVLVIRNAVDDTNFDFIKELTSFEYKRARFNVCFGKELVSANMEDKQGSIISFENVPNLMAWKTKMECICKDEFEIEGNFYYDVEKQELGFMEMVKEKK